MLLLAGAPGLDGQARTSSGSSFTLGVLRRDGVVVPFASRDGGKWLNRWPGPGRRDIPISVQTSPRGWWLRDRPVTEWTAWPLGGQSRVVRVRNPVNLTVECQVQVGLQTDYSSVEPPVPPKMQPYPKDGLATTGDVLVEPVEILDETAADWSGALPAVAAKVAEAETKLVANARFPDSFTERQRATTPFALEVLFRSSGPRPGTTLLYFEGVKRYLRFRTPSDLLTYAAGFVLVEAGTTPKIIATVTLSDRDREGLVYTLALGSFRLEGRLFWAVQRSGWGSERFEILEFAEPEIKTAFKTDGGNCR